MSEYLFGGSKTAKTAGEIVTAEIVVPPEKQPHTLGECNVGDIVMVRLMVTATGEHPFVHAVGDGKQDPMYVRGSWACVLEGRRNP